MSSPVIEGGEFVGGSAGFGTGGPHNGYQTYISPDGTIFTSALDATGFLRAPEISGGSIYGGRIEGGYVLGGVIQGATIIETERKFTVEGNLTYSNGKQVLAVYSASKDFSHSGRPQDGGGHVIFWTNYLDIYPYNVIYANTERRFRWSTIGDQSLSGITARIVDVRSINYSQNCYLYVEYEDALGKVRVQNHWCGDRHSRQFNITTPCGVFVVDYTVNAHSHNVSLRSISSLHNHRLRRFGVRVDQGYVNHIRTFTANAWARNYERKP